MRRQRSIILFLAISMAVLSGKSRLLVDKADPGVVFATWLQPGCEERDVLMLVSSLREFGGSYARCPVWVYVPRSLQGGLAPRTRERLQALKAELIDLPIAEEILRFPFAAKVSEAAAAEARAAGEAEVLAWLDPDTIFIGEPLPFSLPPGKSFASRPVFLKNISSSWGEPANAFWRQLYRDCGVAPARIFPVTTLVDNVHIRVQYNAGLLVVRPERGILRSWRDNFFRLYQDASYTAFYREKRYAVFVHQAILAATIVALLPRREIVELPDTVNYSLVNHPRYPPGSRKDRINGLVTVRSEFFYDDPSWLARLPADEPLKGWIAACFQKAVSR